MSSVGKYIRFQDMSYGSVGDERVYYNQRYHGAATGRWTGTGVQLLNLPRASVDDPEAEIRSFFDGSIVDSNPIKSARALIRPMIKAPNGKALVVADYESIEYVLLEWFAGNEPALKRFSGGFDQYIDQAAAMYGVPYEQVTKMQRQHAKAVILGCGYGQGANKFISTADRQWGMKIDEATAGFMVKGYRKEHERVVRMWYDLQRAAVFSLEHRGTPVPAYKCIFQVVKDKRGGVEWLTIMLPSGRKLYYRSPFIEVGPRGAGVSHYGFSQTIKKWVVQQLIPGRITENIVQGAARDLLVNGMKECVKEGLNIIWTCYDEVICEENDYGDDYCNIRLDFLSQCMCRSPEWSSGLPLRASGYWGQRYKKA
jgi:DNA polymerase